MGRGGTDVARRTAKLILGDDNFAYIVNGIEEGRIAYDNVRKVVWLLISTSVAELALWMGTASFTVYYHLMPKVAKCVFRALTLHCMDTVTRPWFDWRVCVLVQLLWIFSCFNQNCMLCTSYVMHQTVRQYRNKQLTCKWLPN